MSNETKKFLFISPPGDVKNKLKEVAEKKNVNMSDLYNHDLRKFLQKSNQEIINAPFVASNDKKIKTRIQLEADVYDLLKEKAAETSFGNTQLFVKAIYSSITEE